jgi:glycosyltransferase involved in cell wall biosynthesis
MHLELLIPTLRRPALLRATLASVARAAPPRTIEVSVTVVNNDTTPLVLEPEFFAGPYPLRVLAEPRSGKSVALNTGIAASTADYIGMIDDDEEIAADWFLVLERALSTGKFDFIGGRTLLLPLTQTADWLPPGYPAVLGRADSGPHALPYGPAFPGMLTGGNAVISRALLRAAGPYSTALGPRIDRRLFSCEDEDMYWRLVDAGARGQYLPELIVHHHVHPERLRKSYYRAWCFWNGASKSVLSRWRPLRVPHIAGVPRYLYGAAFRGLLTWFRTVLSGGPAAQRMAGELPAWHLAGRLYGRHVHAREEGTRSFVPDQSPAEPLQYSDGTPVIGSSRP